uniref:BZIP domain-containing protein n=1 Tax=Rhodosorus marinus TaxID=101924 RepID=A0A7S3E7W8_9RHOD|mmetsp:Transcript_12820/g.51377  ORF Transcript_12820/g.51377 Transcript_12820/m.51377 type:complete len:148 (+) Transcript_12820:152-595(+)|eukprot:CAMPEP_0113955060 /NCGR_PEP_ID=MMETSP0011_2-20120614/1041_1 /TAXON_ID=101924 /ORGANISM="Rhodosorus marinus" /LENGTH=147 /DNA_ID=CAMNT_0000964543 /DNA_START=110 /DNA_END=553 /DNA_ORIENTATION=+ /assembly_acc=CAM_ASM_000156
MVEESENYWQGEQFRFEEFGPVFGMERMISTGSGSSNSSEVGGRDDNLLKRKRVESRSDEEKQMMAMRRKIKNRESAARAKLRRKELDNETEARLLEVIGIVRSELDSLTALQNEVVELERSNAEMRDSIISASVIPNTTQDDSKST